MSINCLPKESIHKLKPHLKEFDIAKMFDMTTKDRFNIFDQYLSSDEAFFVNKEFEKAMVSSQNEALSDWVRNTFIGKENKDQVKDITDRINEMETILGDNETKYMEGLISEKMGFTVTAEEFENISKRSEELEKLAEKESEFGTPTAEYFTKRDEMIKYVSSLSPTHKLKVLTSTVGRGMMLASIKSPITNILGNTTLAISESLSRRIADTSFKGLNGEYAKEFWKFNNEVYQKSGYDLSRMISTKEDQKRLGEKATHSEGKGMIRRIGRFSEDIVFKQLMGAPDVAFASAHFVDSANINSTKIAREEGLEGNEIKIRALEIFKDATRIDPVSNEGQMVREKAMNDAMRSTFTDETVFSRLSLGLRKVINDISGDVRLGDLLVPFAKTPANVIARSIEASGVTLPYDIGKLAVGIAKKNPEMIKSSLSTMTRAGVGLLGGWMLLAMLDPDDYIGEYSFVSPKERELVELKRATYNSIKIGDKWYSMDYFGPFAGPLVGLLNARKYGKGGFDELLRYVQGVGQQLQKIPGLDEVRSLFSSEDVFKEDASEIAKDMAVGLIDFTSSRIMPGIASDLAKSIDDYERDVKFGTVEGAVQSAQRKIPGATQELDPKIDIFGEKVETQYPAAQLAFGARYKKGKENAIINELNRLNSSANLPSLTDVRRSSVYLKRLADKIGHKKWLEAFMYFGKNWKSAMNEEISSPEYKSLSDEEKKKRWNDIKGEVLKETLTFYGG